MSDCDRLSERMPLVAAGSEEWSAAESAHLATCAACRDEWKLLVATRGLGSEVVLRASPDVMAATLLARLRQVEQEDRRRRRALAAGTWGGLALVATTLLVVMLRAPEPTTAAGGDSVQVAVAAAPFEIGLPELDGAEREELQAVLDALDAPLAESTTLDGGATDGVETEDLERVLRAWEG
ncbi:MAG TPA: hypothetical protein VFX50_00175 [Gemmatimonadales bacterium]|nr:hypothetical protein [Gemmatimonadales bacterium]